MAIGQNVGKEKVLQHRTGGASVNVGAGGKGVATHMGKFDEEGKNLGQNVGKETILENRPTEPLHEPYGDDQETYADIVCQAPIGPGAHSEYLGHFASKSVLKAGHNNIGKKSY